MNLALTDMQAAAYQSIARALKRPHGNVFVLHGLAGTGKTTVLSRVAREFPQAQLCSLTGKAASVLARKTGMPARTVHSMFYQLRGITRDDRKRRVMHWRAKAEEMSGKAILLDECSMIDRKIAEDILRTGAAIIACGDPGQLPPVVGKQFFDTPDFTLTEIMRQAQESPIIRQAHRVRQGLPYEADGEDFRISQRGTEEDIRQAGAILCWTNKTKDKANQRARSLRGYWMPHPQRDEPVICLKNNPDYGLFNGAVYSLLEPFIEGDTQITIDVDGIPTTVPNTVFRGISSHLDPEEEAEGYFDYGYAMTVHKAQGSEWDSVVLIDEYNRRDERARWLYTGITRASRRLLVLR